MAVLSKKAVLPIVFGHISLVHVHSVEFKTTMYDTHVFIIRGEVQVLLSGLVEVSPCVLGLWKVPV